MKFRITGTKKMPVRREVEEVRLCPLEEMGMATEDMSDGVYWALIEEMERSDL